LRSSKATAAKQPPPNHAKYNAQPRSRRSRRRGRTTRARHPHQPSNSARQQRPGGGSDARAPYAAQAQGARAGQGAAEHAERQRAESEALGARPRPGTRAALEADADRPPPGEAQGSMSEAGAAHARERDRVEAHGPRRSRFARVKGGPRGATESAERADPRADERPRAACTRASPAEHELNPGRAPCAPQHTAEGAGGRARPFNGRPSARVE
jgi:hypothetical protein